MQSIVEFVLAVLGVYAGLGLMFAVALHVFGLTRVDPAARGAGAFFRILVTPGIVATWPLMATRWRRAASGGPVFGAVHRPLSATALRSHHRRLAMILAVLVPIAAALGIVMRPFDALSRGDAGVRLPEPAELPELIAVHETPFPGLPVTVLLRGDSNGDRQVTLEIEKDLEIPTLFLFWSPEDAIDTRSVFLGSVWGPGVRRYDLPKELMARDGFLVLHSMTRGGRVAAFCVQAGGRPCP